MPILIRQWRRSPRRFLLYKNVQSSEIRGGRVEIRLPVFLRNLKQHLGGRQDGCGTVTKNSICPDSTQNRLRTQMRAEAVLGKRCWQSRCGTIIGEIIMKIPQHVAIILDGNGRWAKSKGMPRNYGHAQGSKNVETICREAGIWLEN